MIKKITLALLLIYILVSCGKKGDPKYMDPENKVEKEINIVNKA
tara:strand:- start:145 stop:276 length:132 start_codon:yes stop_codon:yes gene_type:complete